MNKPAYLLLFLLFAAALPALSQRYADAFSYERGTFMGTSLSYRKAEIGTNAAERPAVVIYLHGGSSKGNDNTLQMQEPGVEAIYSYLARQNIRSTFIVPQCPKESSWGAKMNAVVKALIDAVAADGAADEPAPRYVLGGSMGGTATVAMLSAYPAYFAGGMAVAANPANCLAGNVAQTPFYTVMGTADVLMEVSAMEAFTQAVEAAGGKVAMDVEEGWTHEQTCKLSYTEERLAWLFGDLATGIAPPAAATVNPGIVGIYAVDGKKRARAARGVNIVVTADGSVRKVMVR